MLARSFGDLPAVIGSGCLALRGRDRVAVGTKSGKDVTDQSIGYTGCGGEASRPEDRHLRPHAEKSLVAGYDLSGPA